MKSPRKQTQSEGFVVYECKFSLYIQDLQAQMYFPSSFQVQWRSKSGDILGQTSSFKAKSQQNQVRFDETLLNSTIIMVYDKTRQSYIQKDTLIVVNYYLNNKPNEIKELGRLGLRMGRFMDNKGQSVKVKSDNRVLSPRLIGRSKQPPQQQQQRYFKSPPQQSSSSSVSEQLKCMRLQSSQYNAKLRFNCTLIQCKQSKLPLQRINIQEFNDVTEFGILKRSLSISNKVSNGNSKLSSEDINEKLNKKTSMKGFTKRVSMQQKQQAQKTIKYDYNKKKQQSINTEYQQRTTNKQSDRKQQQQSQSKSDPKIPKIQSKQQKQTNNKLITKIQQLQQQNNTLKHQLQTYKQSIQQQHTQQLSQLNNRIYQLQQQLRQKQLYYLSNLQKLQQVDQLRYQLIQIRDYSNKLQQRLVVKYKQKQQFIQGILRGVQGSKLESRKSTLKDIVFNANNSHMNNHYNSNLQLVSSITIIDEVNSNNQESNKSQRKGLSISVSGKQQQYQQQQQQQQNRQQSQQKPSQQHLSSSVINVSNIRQSRKHETKGTIVDNLYNLSNSEIQLTNSQMRMIEGSTVKMQHELQYMMMELYQVKAQVNFQQQKYQTQCIHHQETKMELFQLQNKIKQVKQSLSMLQTQHLNALQYVQKLEKQNTQLKQDIKQILQRQLYQSTNQNLQVEHRKQLFLIKQQKYQQQYQLNIIIKQQKIQAQTLLQRITKHGEQTIMLKSIIQHNNKQISNIQKDNVSLMKQVKGFRQQNIKLHCQVQEFRVKQCKINEYLCNLQHQMEQVYKIVQQKELNEDNLLQQIKQKDERINKIQVQLQRMQLMNKNYQLFMQKCQSRQQSLQQQQQAVMKYSTNNSNTKLLLANKQLLGMLNKNATNLVLYQKQKKQLAIVNNQLKQIKLNVKVYQQTKQQYDKVIKQKQLKQQQQQVLKQQLQQYQTDYKQQTDKLTLQISTTQQDNIKSKQQLLSLNNKLYQLQNKLITNTSTINQLQSTVNKLNKQKKLLQQSVKVMQQRNRSYQSTIISQQNTINKNQLTIKQIQTKLKLQSIQSSQEMSSIKIQSHIYNNNNNQNNNNNNNNNNKKPNMLLRQNSLQSSQTYNKQQDQAASTIVQSLLTQIQQLKQQLSTYKTTFQTNSTLTQNKKHQQNTITLVHMMQLYLKEKNKANANRENLSFNRLILDIYQLRGLSSSYQQQSSKQQTSHKLNKKAQQISRSIVSYKSKLLRDNRNMNKTSIESIINPLNSIQTGVRELVELTQLM